jgi:hypothetical protein
MSCKRCVRGPRELVRKGSMLGYVKITEKLEAGVSVVGTTDKYTLNTRLVQNPQGRKVPKTNSKLYCVTYVRLGKVPTRTTEAVGWKINCWDSCGYNGFCCPVLHSVTSVYVQDTSSRLLDMQARGSVWEADDRESLVLTVRKQLPQPSTTTLQSFYVWPWMEHVSYRELRCGE